MLNSDQLIEKTKRVIDSCDNVKQFEPCIAYVKLVNREINEPGSYAGFLKRIEKRFLNIVNN